MPDSKHRRRGKPRQRFNRKTGVISPTELRLQKEFQERIHELYHDDKPDEAMAQLHHTIDGTTSAG